MNNTSKTILQLLYLFFSLVMIFCYAILAVFGFILVTQTLGLDIGKMKEIKINLKVFGSDIKDIQSLTKTHLIFVSAYGIITALLHILLFKTINKIINTIKLRIGFSNEIVRLLSKTVQIFLIIGILYFLMGFIFGFINNHLEINLSINNIQYFLFAGIVYVIEQVYRQGLTIQQENDLTI